MTRRTVLALAALALLLVPAGADDRLEKALEAAKADASRLRGLPFLEEIPVRRITADDLQELMTRDVRRIFGEGEHLAHMEELLRTLRILPAGTGVRELLDRFFPKTVAANYDPFTGRISFLADFPNPERLHSVMVHELVHALQDQHHHLAAMALVGELTFDRLLALGALVEGDAENTQRTLDTGGLLSATPLETIRAFGEMQIRAYLDRMRDFPRGIARPFIFQYLDGLLFVETLKRARGGTPAVDAAFRDPPTTTEQILHPGKYLNRDLPVRILPPPPPEGFEVLAGNVLGELGASIVLSLHLGEDYDPAAAEGWGGDRVLLLGREDGARILVWYTTWDTPEDAGEFAEAARRLVAARADPEAGTTGALFAKDRDVLLALGLPAAERDALLHALRPATKEAVSIERSEFGAGK